MLSSLRVRNFRGLRALRVDGFGRVNLVVGKNDSGKTSLLGAVAFASGPGSAAFVAPFLDDPRGGEFDYARHVLPLFGAEGVKAGLQVEGDSSGDQHGWRLDLTPTRTGFSLPLIFSSLDGTASASWDDEEGPTWVGEDGPKQVELSDCWWSPAFVEPEHSLLGSLIPLYQTGGIGDVVARVQTVNPDLENIEMAGDRVYVRMKGVALPLPLGTLGDGSRRMLEFAVAAMGRHTVLIDEIENGFHASTLPAVFGLLHAMPSDCQVFATTHRDEAVRAACETFVAAGDDGLRIIRLDRLAAEHRAVVYTPAEVLSAMAAGLDVRG